MTDESSWLLVDFRTEEDLSALVADDLWSRGVAAIEELPQVNGTVILRTSLGDDVSGAIEEVIGRFPSVTAELVEISRAVADKWREHVTPTHVVDDVWLVPAWFEPPGGRCVMVEPFDTFGLGNHPTTVLTLRSTLPLVTSSSQVLDVGSGSGVLSVALAVLVGTHVDAHDIAPQGESALVHNASLNGVTSLVAWRGALTLVDADRYDVVMANILAPVLRELAVDIKRSVRIGGHIVLSGLREDQEGSVLAAFHGCTMTHRDVMGGWSVLTLRREL